MLAADDLLIGVLSGSVTGMRERRFRATVLSPFCSRLSLSLTFDPEWSFPPDFDGFLARWPFIPWILLCSVGFQFDIL